MTGKDIGKNARSITRTKQTAKQLELNLNASENQYSCFVMGCEALLEREGGRNGL